MSCSVLWKYYVIHGGRMPWLRAFERRMTFQRTPPPLSGVYLTKLTTLQFISIFNRITIDFFESFLIRNLSFLNPIELWNFSPQKEAKKKMFFEEIVKGHKYIISREIFVRNWNSYQQKCKHEKNLNFKCPNVLFNSAESFDPSLKIQL